MHAALEQAPNVDASRIQVEVKDRTVYLSGVVGSPRERKMAHDVAHSVEGVEHVYAGELALR